MIGAILASLGTFRSARRLRSAWIFSCHWAHGRARPPDRSSPGGWARRRCRRSSAGAGSGRPRLGASWPRPARPARSGTADRVEQPAEAVEHRGQHALGDRASRGSRSRALTNSTYQSQKSFQVKSRSRLVASANRKASRSAVVVGDRLVEHGQDPAVLDGQVARGRRGRARSPPGSSGRTGRRSRTCWRRSGPARTARRC